MPYKMADIPVFKMEGSNKLFCQLHGSHILKMYTGFRHMEEIINLHKWFITTMTTTTTTITATTTITTILQPLYRTTSISQHPQLRT